MVGRGRKFNYIIIIIIIKNIIFVNISNAMGLLNVNSSVQCNLDSIGILLIFFCIFNCVLPKKTGAFWMPKLKKNSALVSDKSKHLYVLGPLSIKITK